VAVYIARIVEINESTFKLLSVFSTILLVMITAIYVIFTYGILNATTKAQKIAFIEKRLEKLYYPLQDYFLKSPELFKLCYHDEIMKAVKTEDHGIDIQNSSGQLYIRPENSILYERDRLNASVNKYSLDSIIPYNYLEKKELSEQLESLRGDLRDINPTEVASSNLNFKKTIDQIKTTIANDINSLIEEHNNLLYSKY
jgi:hypothetical protein